MTLVPSLESRFELDSHTLRIVRAISETGSITAAAAALGFSQPAISQHLKRAETRIGMPIVARAGRGVRLTEAGRVLARHAGTITTALDAAAGELSELAGLRAGRVRIAAFPSASPTLVPKLLGKMAQVHPGIGISYLEAEPPEAVQAVREQQADLAVTFSYPGDRVDPHKDSARGLVVAPLWRDEMLLALPGDHPQAASGTVALDALAAESWIAGCPRCRGHLLQLAEKSGFEPAIAYETDNFVAVLGMVAARLGVALIPSLAVDAASVPSGVVIRPTSNRDYRTIHLVGAAGSEKVPAIAATTAVIVDLDTSAWSLGPAIAAA
ncbi:LysR family transcriptional regulator [Rathayibacter soli]|uniref:LysR family transcriptional regulator n=1 Tax=Rathayibacter soli TaxID=3144168 RepID=UPI0027E4305D|nr:LysR substrate-binding domain-containing protein [Glaciibacter superstes]